MIYEQQGLWGETDLEFAERTAIELIKTFEPVALQRCPQHGYVLHKQVLYRQPHGAVVYGGAR